MKTVKKLTEGNIYRNFLLYAIPMILSSLLSNAYNTIDAMIAGKFISEHAVGAISATASLFTIFQSLINGFAGGFAIYISQLFGRGNLHSLKRDVLSMTAFISAISALISVFIIAFRHPIMAYLKVDPLLYGDAEIYLIIYSLGLLILFVNSLLVSVLHALGITSFSLYVSLISAVLNIGGNLLSVVVLKMGVAGIGISTLLSAAAATAVYLVILRKAFRDLEIADVKARFSLSCIGDSLRYTLPAALQMLAFHGITFLIAPAVNGLGADATTGYNVANRIYALCTPCLWAATSAFGCYTAQCVGEGDCQKIRKGVKVGFSMNILMLLPFVIVFCAFAKPIVSLFFPDGYFGDAYLYAVRYSMVFLPFVYVQLVGHILHAYMRSLGKVSVVLWVTVVASAVRVVFTLLLVPLLGLDGAFLGQIIGWAADAIICVLLFFFRFRTEKHLLRVVQHIHKRADA